MSFAFALLLADITKQKTTSNNNTNWTIRENNKTYTPNMSLLEATFLEKLLLSMKIFC